MAYGKAKKRQRNLQKKITEKLNAKMATKEFKEQFIKDVKSRTESEFNMRIYSYELLGGKKMTKKEWIEWIKLQ